MKKLYRQYVPFMLRQKLELALNKSDYFLPQYDATGCLFIHVPKGAGTSISHALYGKQIANHYPASLYHEISAKKFSQYFSFSIVRNPWDRLVSAYNFVKQGGTEYVRPVASELYNQPEFDEFETFVKYILSSTDLYALDKVFHPQHAFVCDKDDNILVNHIGRIEALDDTLAILSANLGREIEVPKLNKVSRKESYLSFYNEETYDIVAKVYEKDCKIFGYDK